MVYLIDFLNLRKSAAVIFLYRDFSDLVFTGAFFFKNPKGLTEKLTLPVHGHIRIFFPAKFHTPSHVH
jgi:hypothetical protein